MALLWLLVLVFAASATVGCLASLLPIPTWLIASLQITAAFAAAWVSKRY